MVDIQHFCGSSYHVDFCDIVAAGYLAIIANFVCVQPLVRHKL